MMKFQNDWDDILYDEFKLSYIAPLKEALNYEYLNSTVFPPKKLIFSAFKLTPYQSVKAVILGQDPYHNDNEAHGLCFSVPSGIRIPPSLKNIFKELCSDLAISQENNCGDLTKWAENGVLLLNTSLTVRKNQPNSHKEIGWQIFTDHIIQKINEKQDPVVFFLWGANARSKKKLIDVEKHLVIESAHPSPLSAYNGFFGSKPFSRCNEFLKAHCREPINWLL